jgi:hypothetical protein
MACARGINMRGARTAFSGFTTSAPAGRSDGLEIQIRTATRDVQQPLKTFGSSQSRAVRRKPTKASPIRIFYMSYMAKCSKKWTIIECRIG